MKPLKILAVLLFYTVSQVATAVILPIKGDTHITTSPTPLGNFTSLNVDPTSKALLSFNLSALPNTLTSADIEKATLVFYVNKLTKPGQVQVMPVISSWIEQTANNATLVTTDMANLVASESITRLSTYNFLDVTNIVKDWVDTPALNYGLVMQPYNSTPTTIGIDSKEAGVTSHPAYIDIVFKFGVGVQGPKGDIGDTGLAGPQGLPGSQGPQGLTGPAGPAGEQGAMGLTGPQGLTGSAGAQGPMGLTGPQGPTGADGLQGPKGDKGDTGATGPAGTFPSFAYKVGDTGPGGGVIFFVDYFNQFAGFDFLESAPSDLAAVAWCDNGTSYMLWPALGPYGAFGAGKTNTVTMLSGCASGAANTADSYISPNGVSDWYLPSYSELKEMFTVLRRYGKLGLTTLYFWSSTADGGITAVTVHSAGEAMFTYSQKANQYKVWPIRSF